METTICPGCHFACAIDAYQCGRGEKLHARWAKTGELPERRRPGRGGPAHGGSTDDRLMHLLHIIGIALHDLADESSGEAPDRRIIECLMRQGGSASLKVIEGRTGLSDADDLIGRGLAERRAGSQGTTFYALTDEGLEQARAWEAQRKASEAAFLSPLGADEKEQLTALIMKVLEPGFKRREHDARRREHITV